jgi:hypothetical protein
MAQHDALVDPKRQQGQQRKLENRVIMEETKSREAHSSLPAGAGRRQSAVNPWPIESRTPLLWAMIGSSLQKTGSLPGRVFK